MCTQVLQDVMQGRDDGQVSGESELDCHVIQVFVDCQYLHVVRDEPDVLHLCTVRRYHLAYPLLQLSVAHKTSKVI